MGARDFELLQDLLKCNGILHPVGDFRYMRHKELMVGLAGWEHAQWAGSYYPEALPSSWRLGYCANDYRAILVPDDHWLSEDPPCAEWPDEVDEDFRFVLCLPDELNRPDAAWQAHWAAFIERLPLGFLRAAGFVLAPHAPDAGWLSEVLHTLNGIAPVCVDLDKTWRSESVLSICETAGAGHLWRVGQQAAPNAGGRLLVALCEYVDPALQRGAIETLGAWMDAASDRCAGIFFEGATAPAAAAQARIIAEMMAI